MRTMKIGRKVPPHGGNGTQPGGIPIMRLHHKDGVNTDRTGKQRSLPSPTGGVKSTSPDTANHEQKWLRKII